MCVIIVAKNMDLTVEEIGKAISRNPDGNGVIIQDGSELIVKKSISEQDLLKLLGTCKPSAKVMFHARIATSGGINNAMCHPFKSESGRYLLMHNGVIGGKYSGDANKSDTAKLASELDGIFSSVEKGRAYMRSLAKDNFSKFVVFDTVSGSYELFGEWSFQDGVTRSNENHTKTYSYYGSSYGSKYDWDDYNYGYKTGKTMSDQNVVSRRKTKTSQESIKEIQDWEKSAYGDKDTTDADNWAFTWGQFDEICLDCANNGHCSNLTCQEMVMSIGVPHGTAKIGEITDIVKID